MREPKPKNDSINETHKAAGAKGETDKSGSRGQKAMNQAAKKDAVGQQDTSGAKAKQAMNKSGKK